MNDALNTLGVIHYAGEQDGERSVASGFFSGPAVIVDTCQRSVWVGQRARQQVITGVVPGVELFTGRQAYEFLLKFATGLLSAVPGETNVFGQIKDAWRHHQARFGSDVCMLDQHVMAQLFADTKRIRSSHLQHIGGRSYGTLLRHVLEMRKNQPVLIVGSGNLARSIAPALQKNPLAVWARRPDTWLPAGVEQRFGPGEEEAAARWAAHIVFCTPPAGDFEQVWLEVLQKQPVETVVHLGHRVTPDRWQGQQRFLHLEHLFSVQRERADLRSLRLARAHNECAALAHSRTDNSAGNQAVKLTRRCG